MHATINQTNYRALPAQDLSSTHISTTGKCKHGSKLKDTRPIHYFEGSSSEDDDTGHPSGDGSSSGEDLDPALAKRQKTSRIMTRSSTRTPAPDIDIRGASNSGTLSPALLALPTLPVSSSVVTSGAAAITPSDTNVTTLPDPTNPQFTGTFPGTTDAETVGPPPSDTSDGGDPRAKSRVIVVTGTNLATTAADLATLGSLSAVTLVSPSPSMPPIVINVEDVPAFLLCHGKGKHEVNIFAYLDQVQDTCF